MLTPEQAYEISRLAGLLATARCRWLALGLGKGSPLETKENATRRLAAAEGAFHVYLKSITKEY